MRGKVGVEAVKQKLIIHGSADMKKVLMAIYDAMDEYFGDLAWWPGETSFEVALGAILTQNTNWKNVEQAIERIRSEDLLEPEKLYKTEKEIVADLIRPAGYYNVKTERLFAFLEFLHGNYEGDMKKMRHADTRELRDQLLAVKGIGEETADSILLYALKKTIFVVDAYTRRILERHRVVDSKWSYREIQSLFMNNLHHDYGFYNRYHALLVETAKQFCRKRKKCEGCPLEMIGNA